MDNHIQMAEVMKCSHTAANLVENLKSLHVRGLDRKFCLTLSDLMRFDDSDARTRLKTFISQLLNGDLAALSSSWVAHWPTQDHTMTHLPLTLKGQ